LLAQRHANACGSNIKALRIAVRDRRTTARITQEEPAERAGLHPTYVSMVERGGRNPTLDVAARIAKALNLSVKQGVNRTELPRWTDETAANMNLTMSIARTIISEPLRAAGVGLLRAVHCWTGRHYRRAVIRRELRRIGREIARKEGRGAGGKAEF